LTFQEIVYTRHSDTRLENVLPKFPGINVTFQRFITHVFKDDWRVISKKSGEYTLIFGNRKLGTVDAKYADHQAMTG